MVYLYVCAHVSVNLCVNVKVYLVLVYCCICVCVGEYVYSAAVFAVQLQIDPLSPRAIPTSLRSVLGEPCCHFSQG